MDDFVSSNISANLLQDTAIPGIVRSCQWQTRVLKERPGNQAGLTSTSCTLPKLLTPAEESAAGLPFAPGAYKISWPPRLEKCRFASFLCTIVPQERHQGQARFKLNAIHRHDKVSLCKVRLQDTCSNFQILRLG